MGSSYFALIATQTATSCGVCGKPRQRSADRVEVSRAANHRYLDETMRKRHRQIFWQDSCRDTPSYYFGRTGDVPLRPARSRRTGRRFPLDDY